MIRLKPIRDNEHYEDICALYEYLLYQILPFSPESYLSVDEEGCYYYKEGNRSKGKERSFPPPKSGLRPSSTEFFTKKLKAFLEDRDIPKPLPDSLEGLIRFASPDLHCYLYEADGTVSRPALRNLLYSIPNQENLKKLNFTLNPILKGKEKNRSFLTAIRKLLRTEIFNYDEFSQLREYPALIELMGVTVCPYCNRSFTTTAKKKDGSFHRQNQIDHYAPKSHYPWLALSLNNLIPVCANCNQKKGNTTDLLLYPYEEGFGENYRFQTVPISGFRYLIGLPQSEDEFKVVIKCSTDSYQPENDHYHKRVSNAIERLGLDVLYENSHNAHVAAIYRQRYIFSDSYLDSLVKSFPDHFKTRADVRNMLYLQDLASDDAPLSKLTRDIDAQITQSERNKKP